MNTDSSSSRPPVPLARASGTGLAIAALVLGILAVCLSFIVVGAVLGLVGITLGVIHLKRSAAGRTMAAVGTTLSVLGILATVGFGFAYFQLYRQFTDASSAAGVEGTEWEGVQAPDFTVTTLDGNTVTLSELKGKRVVLDFWATWCPPCVMEIPHFVRLAKETKREELVIVGISSEEANKLRPFVKKHNINYPIASADDLPTPYSEIKSIPTTFFLDRRGIIQTIFVGYHDFEALKEQALQEDYEGDPKPTPGSSEVPELPEAAKLLRPVEAWSVKIENAAALTHGAWDSEQPRILVVDKGKRLHILSIEGTATGQLELPAAFHVIEIGRQGKSGSRLLGYNNWGQSVTVIDPSGKTLWTYDSESGVDGAHWGDLDGDGTDEMVVGMNGGGGLHAISADGKRLWRGSLGNAWNQAVVPARGDDAARVFATEAAGSIKVFDSAGKLLRTLQPNGEYVSPMSAARIAGKVQVIAASMGKTGRTMAFDEFGKIAWTASTGLGHGSWRRPSFSFGDVDRDGAAEWAFDSGNELVIATAKGEKLASLASPESLSGFALLTATDGSNGLLVTLSADTARCYRFE